MCQTKGLATAATRDSLRHYLRGVAPTPPPPPLAGGLTADLMARLPRAAINLFIGHLPASWRRYQPMLNHTRMAD